MYIYMYMCIYVYVRTYDLALGGMVISVAMCCSVLQYVALCCNVVAVCCNVSFPLPHYLPSYPYGNKCCNVLQCVAVCCSVL